MKKEAISKVSGNDIMKEVVALGVEKFSRVASKSLCNIDDVIKQACMSISEAYTKDDAKIGVALTDHATICFSVACGEVQQVYLGGTGTGMKQLCDMFPAWFQEHYEVTKDGKSVKPREKNNGVHGK